MFLLSHLPVVLRCFRDSKGCPNYIIFLHLFGNAYVLLPHIQLYSWVWWHYAVRCDDRPAIVPLSWPEPTRSADIFSFRVSAGSICRHGRQSLCKWRKWHCISCKCDVQRTTTMNARRLIIINVAHGLDQAGHA